MTNDTIHHSAGLTLSEDFVERAMALRGGQNLDSAFLTDLLEAGQSADREVKFMVSEPSLIFMAWLDRLLKQRASGGLRIVGPDIDLDRPADMEGAMRFLTHMLVGTLEEEMAALSEGRHSLLFPPRAAQPGPSVH